MSFAAVRVSTQLRVGVHMCTYWDVHVGVHICIGGHTRVGRTVPSSGHPPSSSGSRAPRDCLKSSYLNRAQHRAQHTHCNSESGCNQHEGPQYFTPKPLKSFNRVTERSCLFVLFRLGVHFVPIVCGLRCRKKNQQTEQKKKSPKAKDMVQTPSPCTISFAFGDFFFCSVC